MEEDMGRSRETRARGHRFLAMLLICTLGLGGYICFDSVGALQTRFMEYLELTSADFSLTYSINAWPNVVICFFGGYLIDRLLGVEAGAVLCAATTCTGHMLFSLGTTLGWFWLVLLGRFVFGVGMEVTMICIECYTILWFRGKELSMVCCLMISITRLGTAIMYEAATPLFDLLSDRVPGKQAVGIVYFTVGASTVVSIFCGLILRKMNPRKYDNLGAVGAAAEPSEGDVEKIQLRDVLGFPTSFWIIVAAFTCFSSSVFVLIPFTQMYFMTSFELSVEEANNVTSFFSILGAVIAPVLGVVVDRVGRLVSFLQAAMLSICLAHLLLAFTPLSPYVGMFFLACGFAMLIGAMSPMLAFIFPQHQLGTAFGVNMAVNSLAYSCNLVVVGSLLDGYGFASLQYYVLAWSVLGVMTSWWLWSQDRRVCGVLNMSARRRQRRLHQLASKDECQSPLKP